MNASTEATLTTLPREAISNGKAARQTRHRPIDVDGEYTPPCFVFNYGRRVECYETGSVDDDIEPFVACVKGARDIGTSGHVAEDGGAAVCQRRFAQTFAPRPNSTTRALAREPLRDRATDAGRGAGDKRGPANKAAHLDALARFIAQPVSGRPAPPSTTIVCPVTYLVSREAK